MSYSLLDVNGKPIHCKARSKRQPATRMDRGVTLYHYEIVVAILGEGGRYRYQKRRFWLPGDFAAADRERILRHDAPVRALTWVDAHRQWLEANEGRLSESHHIASSELALRQWVDVYGANSTVEGTTLAEFSRWVEDRARPEILAAPRK